MTCSGDSDERIVGFKRRRSFLDPDFLRLAFLYFAFRGEPSGTRALILLPGSHLHGPDEARLYSRQLLRRKVGSVDRSCRETNERRTTLLQAIASRLLSGRPADKRRLWR